ncbi:MAG: hypothetical protein IJO70_08845 [Lachnospiraceae bacterium]|nr:hypothetical protein [Lachnospiraceae bacterium]
MNKNNKIVKMNKSIKFNAATFVVAAILLYVIICIIRAAAKEPISIYRVSKSNVNNNISLNAIAVRDEQLIQTPNAGYVCYYIRDGEKIMKGSTVCTVDETGNLVNTVSDKEEFEALLTKDDYQDIRELISLYKLSYQDETFYEAYNFENNVNNKVLELTNEVMMQQITENNFANLSGVKSSYSGVVTYYIDGYENFDISKIKASDFDKSKYNKQTLKTGEIVSAGSNIVKIIPSETWNIVAPITDEQISAISDKESILFKINNSSYKVYMPYTIINGSDGKYINISLDKYMYNYIAERFLTVEIIMDEDEGLKVPNTALVGKDVYKIPLNYLTGGSNQSADNRFNVQRRDENGNLVNTLVEATIFKYDDEYCYVDPSYFQDSDVLIPKNTMSMSSLELVSYTEGNLYQVPLEYLNAGIIEGEKAKISVQRKKEDGSGWINKDVEAMVYHIIGDYAYIDSSAFSSTDILVEGNATSSIAVSVLDIKKLDGVYLANRGTAEFTYVTIIKTVDEFALIKNGEEINVYDNIILDSSKVVENQVIY